MPAWEPETPKATERGPHSQPKAKSNITNEISDKSPKTPSTPAYETHLCSNFVNRCRSLGIHIQTYEPKAEPKSNHQANRQAKKLRGNGFSTKTFTEVRSRQDGPHKPYTRVTVNADVGSGVTERPPRPQNTGKVEKASGKTLPNNNYSIGAQELVISYQPIKRPLPLKLEKELEKLITVTNKPQEVESPTVRLEVTSEFSSTFPTSPIYLQHSNQVSLCSPTEQDNS